MTEAFSTPNQVSKATLAYLIKPPESVQGNVRLLSDHLGDGEEGVLVALEEELPHGALDEDAGLDGAQRGRDPPRHEVVLLRLVGRGLQR